MDGALSGQRGDRFEERGLVGAEAVQAEHLVRAVAGDQGRDPRPAGLDLGDPQQRVATAGEPEVALEAERQIEVAAGIEATLREGVEPREASLAQPDPGRGVGADDDVGFAGRGGANLATAAAGADLPRASDVAEADLEGRVELGRAPEVAAGKLREHLADAQRALLGERPCGPGRCLPAHRAGRYRPSRAASRGNLEIAEIAGRSGRRTAANSIEACERSGSGTR